MIKGIARNAKLKMTYSSACIVLQLLGKEHLIGPRAKLSQAKTKKRGKNKIMVTILRKIFNKIIFIVQFLLKIIFSYILIVKFL
jgi:hypothetical protein